MRRLFWDIEVSPNIVLAWSAGFKKTILHDSIVRERSIISAAWKWQGESKVNSVTWDKRQNDKFLLRQLSEVLEESDEAVAYFGDSFDMPWFRTRCLVHGIRVNPEIKTVDPITWAKKFFFNSNKLDYIAQLLGVGSKIPTGFDLWKRVLLDNCPKALAEMEKYNRNDITILEGVYDILAEAVPAKTHLGVFSGGEKWSCPKCATGTTKLSKTRVTSKGAKQYQMQCGSGHYYSISASSYKDYAKR